MEKPPPPLSLAKRHRRAENVDRNGWGAYLGNDLDLLALAILALGDSRLQPPDHAILQPLRTGDDQLHLPSVRAHQLAKLLTHPLQEAQSVILRQRLQEVLHRALLVAARIGVFLQLGNDGGFVGFGQRGRVQDGGEFRVGFEHLV